MTRTRGVAQRAATSATARPTRTANAAADAEFGMTPIWNPMIILAFFYALLFLIFVGAVAYIVVRRTRRARASRTGAAAAAAAHPITSTSTTPGTMTTRAGQDPEKSGQTLARDSGESSTDGFDDPNKTVTIAHAPAGVGDRECKSSPGTGTGTGTGAGGKRFYACDAASEDWAAAPLPRSLRYSSRTWTQMSLPYHGGNVSELSVAQRETSQVLVWLPSFQSNGGGSARPGSGAGVSRVEEAPGREEHERGHMEELKREHEHEHEQGKEHEQGREQDVSEREVVSPKEDSDTECGVAH